MPRAIGLVVKAIFGLALVLIAIAVLTPPHVTPAREDAVALPEPVVVPRDPIREWSEVKLASMSVEDKARSLFIHHVAGQDPDAMRVTVADRSAGGAGAAGIILMGDNVPDAPEELSAYMRLAIADPELPPIVAVDEEGGEVQRLGFDPYAGADYLRTAPLEDVATTLSGRGALLASVGINVNFGIVADVTSDPTSFIYERTLGDDFVGAAERVAAAVTAESTSVASTLKHFPGHGRTAADSHVGVPATGVPYDEWLATDALPFQAGIEAGAAIVMFGHLAYTAVDGLPASLSPQWHRILRDDMDFSGIAVTDDLRMLQDSGDPAFMDPYANVVAALNAGNDALLYVLPADPGTVGIDREELVHAIVMAVDDGRITTARLDEATMRLLDFRRALAPGAWDWVPPCDAGCLLGGWFAVSQGPYVAIAPSSAV